MTHIELPPATDCVWAAAPRARSRRPQVRARTDAAPRRVHRQNGRRARPPLLGADINLADATGKTPLDYALRFPAPDHATPTENGALEYAPRRPPPGLLEAPRA